jgi:phosphoserine phosphatase
MKLLVCDIEGTIFQPHMIKSAQHASYIWTAIAEALGKDAEQAEINTQQKWRDNKYGKFDTVAAYMEWVNDSISIHKKFGLKQKIFAELIQNAPYVQGVQRFFSILNRDEYIPVFISGGIQNLNQKACRDLDVDIRNSYASCEYYFDHKGDIDTDLTFLNTCNFYGKQELIQISLRRHNLGPSDWIFIGDGINDVSVAESAPLSIGIAPINELREVTDYSFDNFDELLLCTELLDSYSLISNKNDSQTDMISDKYISLKEKVKKLVDDQVGNLRLDHLEISACNKYREEYGYTGSDQIKKRFFGIEMLLQDGEYILALLENANTNVVTSAVLQPFCSAAEIMVNVTLSLSGSSATLMELFNSENSLKKSIDKIENVNLKTVLHAYRKNRNSVSHSCQLLSMEAARSLVRRTYENIQRLELLVNPVKN